MKKNITAEAATLKLQLLEVQIMDSITMHMQKIKDSFFLDVEKAGQYIQWFDTGENKLIEMVQIKRDGTIYLHSKENDIDRLDPSNICTHDLIGVLHAIEKSIK